MIPVQQRPGLGRIVGFSRFRNPIKFERRMEIKDSYPSKDLACDIDLIDFHQGVGADTGPGLGGFDGDRSRSLFDLDHTDFFGLLRGERNDG